MKDISENEVSRLKTVLAQDMKQYVSIILEEHIDVIPEERKKYIKGISSFENNVCIKDSGTISMFANNTRVVMPLGAYKIFRVFKKMPGYGINKKHKSYKEGEILNDNTYYDYIKHAIISGMSVEEFYRDTLLHETMHFCGAGGGSLLMEGFTELKTRELAQKYGLKASRCGYPKEVKIASKLQEMFGTEIANYITFTWDLHAIDKKLTDTYGKRVSDLFFEIEDMMDASAHKVYDHSKFGGLLGPIKKAKAYSKIDYTGVYEKLKEMRDLLQEQKRDKTSFVPKAENQPRNKFSHFITESKRRPSIVERDPLE